MAFAMATKLWVARIRLHATTMQMPPMQAHVISLASDARHKALATSTRSQLRTMVHVTLNLAWVVRCQRRATMIQMPQSMFRACVSSRQTHCLIATATALTMRMATAFAMQTRFLDVLILKPRTTTHSRRMTMVHAWREFASCRLLATTRHSSQDRITWTSQRASSLLVRRA